jgi:hypothetical protein
LLYARFIATRPNGTAAVAIVLRNPPLRLEVTFLTRLPARWVRDLDWDRDFLEDLLTTVLVAIYYIKI